jgi:hypothetical protein
MAISENWAYLLEPGLREVFYVQRDALAAESKIPLLFNQITSNKAYEYFLGAGGMNDWAEYKGAIEYDDMEQLWRTQLTHAEYVKGFKVERKLVDDDQYNIINARPSQLALSAMRTREKAAADIFNNCASSGTGGDSSYLCVSTHDYSPTNGAHQSNAGSDVLSYDHIIEARLAMRAYEDDRGELIQCMPDTLLEQTAYEIFRTMNQPNTTDYVANFVGSWLKRVVVWDYLTTSNHWWLIDSRLAKQYLLFVDRVPLEFEMDPTSDFRLEARFRGYMRYSTGWSDWRWVYGQLP